MKTILSLIAGASILAVASAASAQEPVKLSDRQMDQVTAGFTVFYNGAALGQAAGQGVANLITITDTATTAFSDPTASVVCTLPCASATGVSAVGSISVYTNGLPLNNASAISQTAASSALY